MSTTILRSRSEHLGYGAEITWDRVGSSSTMRVEAYWLDDEGELDFREPKDVSEAGALSLIRAVMPYAIQSTNIVDSRRLTWRELGSENTEYGVWVFELEGV